jgi:hypothetical protein
VQGCGYKKKKWRISPPKATLPVAYFQEGRQIRICGRYRAGMALFHGFSEILNWRMLINRGLSAPHSCETQSQYRFTITKRYYYYYLPDSKVGSS